MKVKIVKEAIELNLIGLVAAIDGSDRFRRIPREWKVRMGENWT